MTQEDGFIEVKCYLKETRPILKWVRPVKVKKLRLLFDVFAMMAVARDSDLDFTQMDQMDPHEYLSWMVYGGILSYAALTNERPRLTVEDAVSLVDGMMQDDRMAILRTIQLSRELGKLAADYQQARNAMAGGDTSKKAQGKGSGQQS